MRNDRDDRPFSQRNGLAPLPPQLEIGEISPDLRRRLVYYVSLEFDRKTMMEMNSKRYSSQWVRVAQDLWVLHLKLDAKFFPREPSALNEFIGAFLTDQDIGPAFDLVEFFIRHDRCSAELKGDISRAFVESGAAYRVVGNQIVAIGTEEQAAAFEQAITATEMRGALAARKHLMDAGVELRNGNWAGSVRESIHAVEATAVSFAPNAKTLGEALGALEKQHHLHGALKDAFKKLYGYTNDEQGIRHAVVFDGKPKVDETDALFMLGACASFVSYLLARLS